MSAQVVVDLFESSLSSTSPEAASVIRRELQKALDDVTDAHAVERGEQLRRLSKQPTARCAQLGDLGNYMVRVASVMAKLSINLTEGEHVEQARQAAIQAEMEDTDFSEMQHTNIYDADINKLQKIRDLSNEFQRNICDAWASDSIPASPNSEGFATAVSEMDTEQPHFKSPRKVLPDTPRPLPSFRRTSTAADTEFEDDRLNKIDRDQLKRRGVGANHVCPLGSDCTKGGWSSKDGAKEFPRNSSFLAHLNKHARLNRCDHPNCPNPPDKRRFARIDGLTRHMERVPHPPLPEQDQPPIEFGTAIEASH